MSFEGIWARAKPLRHGKGCRLRCTRMGFEAIGYRSEPSGVSLRIRGLMPPDSPDSDFRRTQILGVEQFGDGNFQEQLVCGILGGIARSVPPNRGDRAILYVWDLSRLDQTVFGREIQVGLTRQDPRLGLNCSEGGIQVTVIEIVVADVGRHPGLKH